MESAPVSSAAAAAPTASDAGASVPTASAPADASAVPLGMRSGLPFEQIFGGVFDPFPAAQASLVPGRPPLGPIGQGLTMQLGTSITHNSNVYEDPFDEVSGLLSSSDLSLSYHRGQLSSMGPFVGIDYNLAYFQYFDDVLNEGREPYDQDISAFIGLKGAQTTIILSGSYAQNNGNSINQTRLERETLQSDSTDYSLTLSGTRKLRRTSLNASLGVSLQEFGEDGESGEGDSPLTGTRDLTDLTSWDGSLGWSVTPQSTPKTDLNLSLGFGGSEQQDGVEETFVSPAVGMHYRLSDKTSLFGTVGFDARSSTSTRYVTTTTTTTTAIVPVEPPAPGVVPPGGMPPVPMTVTTSTSSTATSTLRPTTPASVTTTGLDGSTTTVTTSTATEEVSFDQTNPTYSFGASWSPDETTAFSIAFSRSTSASALAGQSSSDTTDITLAGSKQFPRGYFASMDYSIQNSSYVDSLGVEESGSVNGRPENYHRFGVNFGRSLQIKARLAVDASVFYQLNKGTGEDPLSVFDQTIVGFRVGMRF